MRTFDQSNRARRPRAGNFTQAPRQEPSGLRAGADRACATTYPRFGHDFTKIPVSAQGPPAAKRSQDTGAVAPPIVHRVLASPGQPLFSAERNGTLTGLDQHFAQVRVHSDALAAESADAVDAGAYTVGSHVVLGRGHGPGSRYCAQTLAHELAHVAQQREAGMVDGPIPVGSPASIHEREADQAARSLMSGTIATQLSSAPRQLSRQPRLTIVDEDSGLTDKELSVIVAESSKALRKTTDRAGDKRVRAGVRFSYQRGLKGVDKLVHRGDVIVYVIGAPPGKKSIPQDQMKKIVHDIVIAQGIVPKDEVDKRVSMLADDVREQVDPATGQLTGQNEYDPGTSVSIVNIDYNPKRGKEGLRAIAGNILHEGPGHRALSRGYHNPENRGVMSEHFGDSATEEQILFQSNEWEAVNKFLKDIVDDPAWNK